MDKQSLQETFWAGEFGNDYIDRNSDKNMVIPNIALFSRILRLTDGVESILELGANIGLNLVALHTLKPDAELTGVEINEKAAQILKQLHYVDVKNCSFYEYCPPPVAFDFVFTKGVLIHQAPERLPEAYRLLYRASKKYIMICEYYNPSPVEIDYRGNRSVLFKRDFAGELMDQYPDLKLLDYGFVYHRDRNFPGDDFTWFLLEKR